MKTRGYTKSITGKIDLMKMLTEKVFKDPNEPFEDWFNRKIEEQFKKPEFTTDSSKRIESTRIVCSNGLSNQKK